MILRVNLKLLVGNTDLLSELWRERKKKHMCSHELIKATSPKTNLVSFISTKCLDRLDILMCYFHAVNGIVLLALL